MGKHRADDGRAPQRRNQNRCEQTRESSRPLFDLGRLDSKRASASQQHRPDADGEPEDDSAEHERYGGRDGSLHPVGGEKQRHAGLDDADALGDH